MIYFIRLLLIVILAFISYGYYLNDTLYQSGDKWIGIAVLLIAFVLLPTFIYHRYKNKKLSDFELNIDKIKENAKDF